MEFLWGALKLIMGAGFPRAWVPPPGTGYSSPGDSIQLYCSYFIVRLYVIPAVLGPIFCRPGPPCPRRARNSRLRLCSAVRTSRSTATGTTGTPRPFQPVRVSKSVLMKIASDHAIRPCRIIISIVNSNSMLQYNKQSLYDTA